jgi:hypothetical protein
LLALLLAAALVPSSAQSALTIEDASGLRALLTSAAKYAPSLSPEEVGRSLRAMVGVDLLAEQPSFGLARHGPRMLAVSRDAIGLSAPVRNAKAARAALESWRSARGDRAGSVSKGRLFTASGRGAQALLKSLAHTQALRQPLAAAAVGPAWIFVRLAHPLRAAVLALDASAQGLVARGVAIAAAPLLAGHAPAGCEGGPPACLRAGLGEAGRGAVALALAQLRLPPQESLKGAARVVERLTSIDATRLDALVPVASFDGPEAPGPALWGEIDLAQLDAALARLTPLDALTSQLTASVYAGHLLYGPLLRNAGPLTLTGDPLAKNAARIELRLPLR